VYAERTLIPAKDPVTPPDIFLDGGGYQNRLVRCVYERRSRVSVIHTKPQITVTLDPIEFRLITQSLTGTLKGAHEPDAESLGEKLLDQLIQEEENRLGSLKKARAALQETETVPVDPVVTVLRPGSTLGMADLAPYGGPMKTKECRFVRGIKGV
jgi:hypothetical protein